MYYILQIYVDFAFCALLWRRYESIFARRIKKNGNAIKRRDANLDSYFKYKHPANRRRLAKYSCPPAKTIFSTVQSITHKTNTNNTKEEVFIRCRMSSMRLVRPFCRSPPWLKLSVQYIHGPQSFQISQLSVCQ